MNQDSNLLNLLYADQEVIAAYKNRNFAYAKRIYNGCKYANNYNHIKQKNRTYIMLDIDNISKDKVDLLFNNDFFTPNFYIYEYSKNKQCYTLQVFILLNHNFNPDSQALKDNYKKLCLLFGGDTQYQVKTGIHKNPMYYEVLPINELSINITNKNHCGYIHSRRYSLDNIMGNLEYFGYLDNLANVDYIDNYDGFFSDFDNLDNSPEPESNVKFITVKTKSVYEVKKTKKTTGKDTGFRNIELFERTRLVVYSMSDQSIKTILHIAHKINAEFNKPLKNAEVNATAKSIYKFITEKFNKAKVDPYSVFQRAKSAEVRNLGAIDKMKMAIIILLRNGKNITPSAIKKRTNQNINTIKNNMDIAYKLAKEYVDSYAKRQARQEKRAKKEFKELVRKTFNKPIRTRSKKTKSTLQKEYVNITANPVNASIPNDLMPSFDTSCDFIFNRGG